MICEKCGKEHDGSFGSGRFCSRSCANSHKHSEEQKQKIANSLKETRLNNGIIKKDYNYIKVIEKPGLDIPIRECVVCGDLFYHTRNRKTCCPECNKINHDKLNKLQKGKEKLKYKDCNKWNDNAYRQIYEYYYTYKIINLVNGKYYYGIHATNNLNDGYLGSGQSIRKAIKKYGKQNFKKEILEYFSCYKDLAEAEHNLVTKEVLHDKNSYNLTLGGIGGPCFKGKHHNEETKKKLSYKIKEVHKNKKYNNTKGN